MKFDPRQRQPRSASRPPIVKKPAPVTPVTPASAGPPAAAPRTDWSDVASWYDSLVGDEGSEYQQKVVFPGAIRMLQPRKEDTILDVACGQGALCRLLAARGARVTGLDSAEPLLAAARERSDISITYHRGDAREIEHMPTLDTASFASAACVLAIQNIHPIAPVFAGVARVLRPMGRFVLVMMHPCFRGPKESSWGWDDATTTQYRRVDRYLIPRKSPIVTHPGSDPDGYTWSFHKPIEAYVRAARGAGFAIDALEEWPSHKTSQPGPRASAENKAREEIPMFLAMRAIKIGLQE